MVMAVSYALAMPSLQDNRQRRNGTTVQQSSVTRGTANGNGKTTGNGISSQPIFVDEDSIPDSLLHPRWKIQRTVPISEEDLDQSPLDLQRPDNLKQTVEYNDSLDRYIIGNKIGGTWISAPIMMTSEEYWNWQNGRNWADYFRKQNDEIFQKKGKEKFDFTDMHFDLGPAEKIFGPGGVRVKTQGTAELKFGGTIKNVDNPALPISNRKTTSMDFDEKINLNVNGKVGDKVNMNLNYNTDATFDFDTQNMKLKYDGKEDEIVKLVEAGNISFPSNSSLIPGSSSLFGLRTDLQFGKLKLQLVASQKKSNSKSVSAKGGVQLTPFEINVANYEENRHFFLADYFRTHYDAAMKTLPNISSGVKINRVEIWVTNKTGTTTNTRNIIALTDLGEPSPSNKMWGGTAGTAPSNQANSEYSMMNTTYAAARNIDQTASTLEGAGLVGGSDFEKVQNARLLSSSEYTVNNALGYVSLKTTLQTDQVLAVAFEYTYHGTTYQVGEFSTDNTDATQALYVKSLKNTSNSPAQGNWRLMMKNVYYLASSVEKDKFRLDVKYKSDTTGTYISYIPEQQVKGTTLLKVLDADRLDNNNKAHANGYFDYVDGYTVSDGRVFLPKAEPFGSYMYNYLVGKGVAADRARQYAFTELYDSTKTVAKQIAEKDKYILSGQFRGTSANVISLGAYNVPQGSVVVTAGGVTLTEGVDYSVDYSAGEVTILNQSIIDAGTSVNVSLESNTDYGQTRKTMFGANWEYDFSKNFQLSGTIQHLSEQALTNKVAMGAEPLNNTLWGVNLNWKMESQWLTNMLDKLPGLHLTQPSQLSFTGEFAQLIAGKASGIQDNASYLDDFESTKTTIDVSTPQSWIISSVPSMFAESKDKTGLTSGFNRSRLAWYNIDPLFTRRTSSLTPSHIKSDLDQLSNYFVREVYTQELFPYRDQSTYSGTTSTLPVLNLAYYPDERGPYNFNVTDLQQNGHLANPTKHWGGMMRKLDTNDFEASNIAYIEFWLMDPFVYTNQQSDKNDYGGDFYINLGDISEDVLKDGKKSFESGMPVDGSNAWTTTQWGRVPTTSVVTYAFATTSGARALQDVGFNGLTDEQEQEFYKSVYLDQIQGKVTQAVFDSIFADPAGDDYHYFRGADWDANKTSILDRYKYINNPQGNSPDNSGGMDTSYKTTPDVEDINQDYTLNEYEKYYQYHISLRPEDMQVGKGYIVDSRETRPVLRNGQHGDVTWYQFRIPLKDFDSRVGGISDFTSIRFMRMFLTNFKKPIVLRFADLDLVSGTWRVYEQDLDNASGTGSLTASSVGLEENSDKTPVNYVLPPGIQRETDPTQSQIVESDEQALNLTVSNLSPGESKAVYKNQTVDLTPYKRIQMFVHADDIDQTGLLKDNQLAVFIRFGSDYKNNYYEYEIPLTVTPAGKYTAASASQVWPTANMLDIPLSVFTSLKKARNKAKALGTASFTTPFSVYDADHPNDKVTIMGNPSLGEVTTMMIGVRNKSSEIRSGEVWVNELRLFDYNNKGGWAAQGTLNMQLSDLGSVNVQGKYVTDGFGGLEDGASTRSTETASSYSVTTSVELGKFFPDKAKVSIPVYYSVSKERHTPRYNPLDTDMELKEALDATASKQERDSIEDIAVTRTTQTNFSVSNARIGIATKGHPMPYDPANFSFSYSHSHDYAAGETTGYERQDNWRGAMSYSWTPVYKTWEPFRKLKSKSKWLDIFKRFGFNYLPQNISFNTEMTRSYYELQERDLEDLNGEKLPLTFNEQFLWNRDFSMRWDLTRNLHMSFQSATDAEIEEPYTPVNKDLYPDRYQAWKDSVWTSIKRMGTPLTYNQQFTASYQLPLNLIPVFDWMNANATYSANYGWQRGTELEDGTTLGNTINNNRNLALTGTFNLERLYNHVPFLKKANEKFNKETSNYQYQQKKKAKARQQQQKEREQQELKKVRDDAEKAGKDPDAAEKKWRAEQQAKKQKAALPKNKRAYEREIVLRPDTTVTVNHGKKTKRLIVSAKTMDGKALKVKYKKVDQNKIIIKNKVDSAMRVKISVLAKSPLEDKGWYKVAQAVARLAMMVRNINISYTNQYQMVLPGYLPSVGNAFGQKGMNTLAPGLDFAFGLTGDSYIRRAYDNGWLLNNDSISTPATTSKTENVQIRATLEPVKNLKIDLTASRQMTRNRSILLDDAFTTTQSGSLTMTTISLGSAFESTGNATSGYHSKTFDKFVNSLDEYQQRVQARYAGSRYPSGMNHGGELWSADQSTVDKYSADVMIPAFLHSYTSIGGHGLEIFPALTKMLPNWTLRYSGLSKLPWFRDVFKSFNINHAYKSIFSIGSYSSYSTYQEYMNDLGFITKTSSDYPIPSSMFDVSSVSISESFSPLLGVDMTFNNNLTAKLEYRKTRVVTLSMTSIQINEARSNDLVIGMGYKLNNFNLFDFFTGPRAHKSKQKSRSNQKNGQNKNNNNSRNNGYNHSLNLRLDASYRSQSAITRDIATMVSQASSGNSAFKISFMADYTLSRMLTMSFYYDMQMNKPLLSSSSYPMTTHDFGLSVKFSLTR
ncbi:MAG: cell surface protein SprA [Prevotella sp.]|nr:cell surface protein SprA [Prevotella sp.]